MTEIDSQVFVVFDRSSFVQVYDAHTFKQLSRIDVEGLAEPHDIAACRQRHELYVADKDGICRLLVTLPRGLRQYNVTDKELTCDIDCPEYMKCLYNGIETTRGTFVISHHGTSHDKHLYAVSSNFRTSRCRRESFFKRVLAVLLPGRFYVGAGAGRNCPPNLSLVHKSLLTAAVMQYSKTTKQLHRERFLEGWSS